MENYLDISKNFIPYELSLELKELGFDEPCFGFYGTDGYLYFQYTRNGNIFKINNGCLSPTFSQAFRFFRDKKYQAEVLWRGDFGDFCWKIGRFNHNSYFFSKDGFNTYEEAELECIKKLIEIAKEQNLK